MPYQSSTVAAFRTADAVNYSDIATIRVDCCVRDFAAQPTNSSVGLLTSYHLPWMIKSCSHLLGSMRSDDHADPDDVESEDEKDEEEDEDDVNVGPILGPVVDGDGDTDDISNADSGTDLDEDDTDGDFFVDEVGRDAGAGISDIGTEELVQ